jgi:hypothetical protein
MDTRVKPAYDGRKSLLICIAAMQRTFFARMPIGTFMQMH